MTGRCFPIAPGAWLEARRKKVPKSAGKIAGQRYL